MGGDHEGGFQQDRGPSGCESCQVVLRSPSWVGPRAVPGVPPPTQPVRELEPLLGSSLSLDGGSTRHHPGDPQRFLQALDVARKAFAYGSQGRRRHPLGTPDGDTRDPPGSEGAPGEVPSSLPRELRGLGCLAFRTEEGAERDSPQGLPAAGRDGAGEGPRAGLLADWGVDTKRFYAK